MIYSCYFSDDQIIRMNKELEDANELIAAMKKKGGNNDML